MLLFLAFFLWVHCGVNANQSKITIFHHAQEEKNTHFSLTTTAKKKDKNYMFDFALFFVSKNVFFFLGWKQNIVLCYCDVWLMYCVCGWCGWWVVCVGSCVLVRVCWVWFCWLVCVGFGFVVYPCLFRMSFPWDMQSMYDAVCSGDVTRQYHFPDNIRQLHYQQENVMHVAARCGRTDMVADLLMHFPEMATEQNKDGKSVLHCAVAYRQTHVVFQLMTYCADWVNLKDKNAQTPLQLAIRHEYLEAVLIMLSSKQDCIHHVDGEQKTVLHLAAKCDSDNVLRLLLIVCPTSFLVTSDANGDTPSHIAVKCKSLANVKLLLKANSSALDIANSDGDTPVLVAAGCDEKNILLYLLQEYPHVVAHKNHKEGCNILHYISNVDIAKQVLQLKPDLVDDIATYGACVLHYVIFNQDCALLEFLLQKNPKLLLCYDKNNESPLDIACSEKNPTCHQHNVEVQSKCRLH